jgi:hypothetical protein
MAALARGAEDLAPELRGAARLGEAAEDASRLARDAELFRHVPRVPHIPSSSAEPFLNTVKADARAAQTELNAAADDLKGAARTNVTQEANNAEHNLGAVAKAGARNTKLGNILKSVKDNPKKALAGVALTAIGGYAAARLDSTDEVQATITNIVINDSSNVQISYTPPSNLFGPTVNDQLTFTGTHTTPSLDGPTRSRIIEIIDNSTLVVSAQLTSNGVAPFGTMTAHSSFENQVVGSATEIVATGAQAIAGAAGAVIDAGAPLAKKAICTAIPFICSKTFYIILAVIAFIIIAVVIYKVAKK